VEARWICLSLYQNPIAVTQARAYDPEQTSKITYSLLVCHENVMAPGRGRWLKMIIVNGSFYINPHVSIIDSCERRWYQHKLRFKHLQVVKGSRNGNSVGDNACLVAMQQGCLLNPW
jgi:hypothetical protein